MLVNEVKPIAKVGKDLLKDKNADELIEVLIEKPLQKACKECKEKNIETVMSSANKKNIVKKRRTKPEVVKRGNSHKIQTFLQAGKGYAWLMINYLTLSDENKKIMFSLEQELGEDVIWFVEPHYKYIADAYRKRFKPEKIVATSLDKYAKQFEEKQLLLMYSDIYPRRSVFIRMPIDEHTSSEEVELYFSKIISKLQKQ